MSCLGNYKAEVKPYEVLGLEKSLRGKDLRLRLCRLKFGNSAWGSWDKYRRPAHALLIMPFLALDILKYYHLIFGG